MIAYAFLQHRRLEPICVASHAGIVWISQVADALESRTAERGVLRKQEIAAPERDRAVGLAVNGQNDAGCVLRLCDAAHDHQDVPVRISIDGAWAQRVR
jgi:hypothetical protein